MPAQCTRSRSEFARGAAMTSTDRHDPIAQQDDTNHERREFLQRAAATSALLAVWPEVAQAVIWEEGEQQCHVPAPQKPDAPFEIDDAALANFMKVSRTLTGVALASN